MALLRLPLREAPAPRPLRSRPARSRSRRIAPGRPPSAVLAPADSNDVTGEERLNPSLSTVASPARLARGRSDPMNGCWSEARERAQPGQGKRARAMPAPNRSPQALLQLAARRVSEGDP